MFYNKCNSTLLCSVWKCLLIHVTLRLLLPEKCERVNLKASQLLRRESLRKKPRENLGVYYFCPVFSFTVPSPSVERDPFPPTHHRCQRGHTQTVRVNVHGRLRTPTLTHGCWQRSQHLHTLSLHHLSLSSVLAVSLSSERTLVLLSPQLFLRPQVLSFVSTGFLLAKGPTNISFHKSPF